ncbi:MAG: methylisocitrate lyase [Alphaproteobacteria bacterium]
MLFADTTAEEKRRSFRQGLKSGRLLRFPGAYSPLVAMLIEELRFDGVYISGAALANDLGLPDIGLTTLTEVSQRARQIARVTRLPAIVDVDTGFGEPMSCARTVQELEDLGLAGCHLEDQENPKRCGHLDNKVVVSLGDMVRKVRAAVDGRRDPNFVVTARTDARAVEGLKAAAERAQAYAEAGADMIFPEALCDEREFEALRKAVDVPLLANMTEFGKSKLLSAETLENLGYNVVIYPVTGQRLAMKAVEDGFKAMLKDGHQKNILDRMQSRARLYELVRYEAYANFDQDVYGFGSTDHE